jgi:hypothetical protein
MAHPIFDKLFALDGKAALITLEMSLYSAPLNR